MTSPTTAVDTSARAARRRATLIGATAALLWSTLAALTVLSGDIPPLQMLAMCFTLGTLVGVAVVLWQGCGRGLPARALLPRLPGRVWALGVYGLFGYHFAYFIALRLAPPVAANLINYLWPLLIVLFAALLPGERLRGRHAAGVLAGFGGAALLVTRGEGLRLEGQYAIGYAFALACAVIWSSYSVLSRHMAAPPGAARREGDNARAVMGTCAATAALALVGHLLFETTTWPAGGQWAAIIAMGLGPVGAAFYTWDHGVKHGDIQTLGVLAYGAPLISTLLLVALGLAAPSWLLAAACVLIVGGAVLAATGA